MAASDVLERNVLLVSFYRAYQRFQRELGVEARDWPELPDEERYAWIACHDALSPAVEATADNPRTFTDLSRVAYDAWRGGQTYAEGVIPPPTFEELDRLSRMVWNCVVRHLANLLVFDTQEDGAVEKHEDQMAGFFAVKAREIKEAQ